jgi:hypothetical protein
MIRDLLFIKKPIQEFKSSDYIRFEVNTKTGGVYLGMTLSVTGGPQTQDGGTIDVIRMRMWIDSGSDKMFNVKIWGNNFEDNVYQPLTFSVEKCSIAHRCFAKQWFSEWNNMKFQVINGNGDLISYQKALKDFHSMLFNYAFIPEEDDTCTPTLDPNRTEPIQQFRNKAHLIACAKEWEKIMGLGQWIIEYRFVDEALNANGEVSETWGHSIANQALKAIIVQIKKIFDVDNRHILKANQEYILVHELAHIMLEDVIRIDADTISDVRENRRCEFITEQTTRALLCARYNLTQDWFREEKQ